MRALPVRPSDVLVLRVDRPRQSAGVALPADLRLDPLAVARVVNAGDRARAAGVMPGDLVVVEKYAPVVSGRLPSSRLTLYRVGLNHVMARLDDA